MANPQVGIDIIARLDKFKAELAKIPDIGGKEARALTAQLSKEIRAAERAAQQAGKAAQAAKGEVRDFGAVAAVAARESASLADHAGRAGSDLGKLSGAAGLVSSDLGEIVRVGADVADVFDVAAGAGTSLASAISALAAPVAIAAGALLSMAAVVDDYAESKREAIRVDQQFAASMAPLEEALSAAQAEFDLMTQAQAAGNDELKAYLAIADLHVAADTKVAESTKVAREERERLTKTLGEFTDQSSFDAQLARNRITALDQEIGLAEEKGRQLKQLAEGSREIRAAVEAQAAAERAEAGAKDEQTAAVEAATSAERAWAEALAEGTLYNLDRAMDASKRRAKIEAENAKIISDATEQAAAARLAAEQDAAARREALDKAQVAIFEKGLQDRNRLVYEYADEALANVAPFAEAIDLIASAVLDSRMDALSDIQSELQSLDALLADLSTSTVDAATLSGEALVDAYRSGAVAASDLTDAQKGAIERQLAAERDALAEQEEIARSAALAAFEIQKGTAISGTTIAGLQAAVNAVAQLGPIAGAAAATGIALLTATNIGLIAAEEPQFHAGGVRPSGGYPDELTSITLPGEGHANRQAMNDPANREALNAMNAGKSVGGGTTVLRIGRHEAREIARTDVRSNGIIPQTIRSIARRSGKGAGLAGRGVLA